jgi:AraC-like DNA-binding protein
MKRIVTVFATAVMCLLLITVSFAESKESSASWDLSGPTEITEEVLDIFHQVTEGLMGVNYEPIALLGTTSLDEQGGIVYCLLCRSTVLYPDAEPSYVLMYLQKPEDGSAKLQNIYEIWVDAHAFPEDSEEQTENMAEKGHSMNEEERVRIEQAVAKWVNQGGYKQCGITIQTTASEMHLSRYQFTAWLKTTDQELFNPWLMNLRIEEAKHLLAEHPDWSNDNIALACGFSSRSYFQNVFHKQTGMTPAQFANKTTQNITA